MLQESAAARNSRENSSHSQSNEAPGGGSMSGETKGESISLECLEKLGKGGFGQVFRVKIIEGDQSRIRIVKQYFSGEDDAFAAELSMLQRIKDIDGVATYTAVVLEAYDLKNQWLFFPASELPTEDLFHYMHAIANDKSSNTVTSDMICQLKSSVEWLHEYGIFHRDIKPSNLIVDTSGSMKLIDFGLAFAVDAADGRRPTGYTRSYCPYETRQALPDCVTQKDDIAYREACSFHDQYAQLIVMAEMMIQTPRSACKRQYVFQRGEQQVVERQRLANFLSAVKLSPCPPHIDSAQYDALIGDMMALAERLAITVPEKPTKIGQTSPDNVMHFSQGSSMWNQSLSTQSNELQQPQPVAPPPRSYSSGSVSQGDGMPVANNLGSNDGIGWVPTFAHHDNSI